MTPHAVERFQARVAALPAAKVIRVVQTALQEPRRPVDADAEGRDGQLNLIYQAWYGSRPMYLVIAPAATPDTWPQVVTVMSVESAVHIRLAKERIHKRRHGRYPDRGWTEREQRALEALRAAGYTLTQCAEILRRSHTTIERHAPKVRPHRAPWSEWQAERALGMRQSGVTCGEIARRIGRSENAVRVWFSRHRRRCLADPRRRRALRLLQIIPAGAVDRALKTIRREGLLCQES